jgi:O-antigen/teichoic acid export membrane protein
LRLLDGKEPGLSVGVKRILLALCPTVLRPYADRIESSPIASRIARGAFWSLAGAVVARGLNLAAMIVVARLLGQAVFGELGIIQSTLGVFQVFAGFALGMTATKYIAEFKRSDPAKAGQIMALSGIVAAVTGALMALALWLSAPWLATHTLAAPNLAGPLRISSFMLLFGALTGAQSGAMAGFEAFRTLAWVNLATGLVSFPTVLYGAYVAGLNGAVWGLVLPMGFGWALSHLMLRREAKAASVPFLLGGCWEQRRVLGRFAIPAVFSSLMIAPVNWVCGAMLVNQPGGYAEMGIFNAANQWFAALLFLPAALAQPLLPILSERLGMDDKHISAKVLKASMAMNAIIAVPIAVVGSILSPFIMGLYGPGYSLSWPVLVVVLATALLVSLQTPVGQIISASGRMWTGFAMNLGWGFVFVTCTWLSLRGGAVGLAGARFAAYIVHSLWAFTFAYILLSRSVFHKSPS